MGDVLHRRGKLYIRWYDGTGKRTLKATNCKTEREAHAVLREREAEAQAVRDGRLVQPLGLTDAQKAQREITVEDLARRFLGDVEDEPGYQPPRIKSIDNYRKDARSIFTARILPALGVRPAASVTPLDVERLRDRLLAGKPREIAKGRKRQRTSGEGLAGASVTQTLAILSKLYNWARRAQLIDCANPVQGVERPRSNYSIDFLSHAEVRQLLAAVDDAARIGVASWQGLALAPMAATAIYCGLRKGELFGLRWTDVKLDAARIDVNRSYTLLPKGGKARHVPMHAELVRILRDWKKLCPKHEGLVFPVEVPARSHDKAATSELRMGEPEDSLALLATLTAAECHAPADGKPWHMLRHTFASHFMMAGGNVLTLQKLLGHAQISMTMRYAHLAPDFLAAEVSRMSFATPSPADVSDLTEERRRRALPTE